VFKKIYELGGNMKFLVDVIKGMLVGVANVIPGVSGGTMMVSMGIYEKIIGVVNNLFKDIKKSILTLLPIGIGLVLGVAVFSFIIPFCLEEFPFPTCFCFIGLIMGGVPAILKPAKESLEKTGKKISVVHLIIFAAFFALAVGMAAMNETETNSANFELSIGLVILLFVVGVVAAATMVIPGVSGSLVLMILGVYGGIMDSISGFIKAVLSWDMPAILHNMGILVPFGLGVVAGIFAVAKLMEWLFAKYPSITYGGILGLVIASPFAIIMKMGRNNINPITVILGIILLAAGAWFTYWFGKKTEGIE
jgi:putative membrane protein